jgi:hypothetical protein
MKTIQKTLFRKLAAASAAVLAAIGITTTARAVSTTVVIYEIYGGGGSGSSATGLNSDYTVLYNLSAAPVSINGWSLQYGPAAGNATNWVAVNLPNASIPAGGYYCVKLNTNATGGNFTADFTKTNIDIGATGGKVVLVNQTNLLTVVNPAGTAPVVDMIGTTNSNGSEGAAAPAMSVTTALRRVGGGCTDTDSNTNDFNLITIAPGYQPANSSFPIHSCSSANPPGIFGILPAAVTNNAGTTATFTAEYSGGDAPITNYWYLGTVTPANLVFTSTNATTLSNATLVLANVGGANAGTYTLVASNATAPTASASAVLTVRDPAINIQPANEQGLLGQSTSFFVGASGTSLTYKWYYADTNGNIIGPVNDGVNSFSSSVNSGSTTATLSISGLTVTDPTNFVVAITNSFNQAVTSTVASLVGVSNTVQLAFWNFNLTNFPQTLTSPQPYFGIGTASGLGTDVPFAGSVDPNDGFPVGLGPTNFSWGSSPYPAQGAGNKTSGVQFLSSTAGARNISISYECRATGTASAYERLQYTTNGGTTWVDFPASTTFSPVKSNSTVTTTTAQGVTAYTTSSYSSPNPFTYDLSGFPGVDNNPAFGFRVMTEFESTGTYGLSPNNNYYGVANTYGTSGTLTYDRVSLVGTAITNNSAAPTVGPILNTNVNDFQTVTVQVPVTGPTPGNLVLSAAPADQFNKLNLAPSPSGNFSFGGSGTNRTMTVTPVQDYDGIAPIRVTATDPTTGLIGTTWFYLTVNTVNGAPTNSLGAYPGTNTLYNASVSLPFTATDDHTVAPNFSYSGTSANNTVIPTANISFLNSNTASPTAVIAPNNNPAAIGVAPVTLTVTDDGVTFNSVPHTDVRSTTVTFPVEVLPNTNCIMAEYFNYDNSGALSTVASGFWSHLSGNAGQIQIAGGVATLNTLTETEALQAKLVGAPYATNTAAVLYASFIINVDPANLPRNNGTYFAVFNDGTGTTGNYTDRIMAATNGTTTPSTYRLGVNNGGSDALTGVLFPQDLVPGSNYVVVTKTVVSNGFSTIWVSPASQASPSVTDTTPTTPRFPVSDFQLRTVGGDAGVVSMSKIKVGTTFESVFPSLHITQVGNNVVLTSSDPTIGVQSSTNVTGPYTDASASTPYTNSVSANSETFYRLGQ